MGVRLISRLPISRVFRAQQRQFSSDLRWVLGMAHPHLTATGRPRLPNFHRKQARFPCSLQLVGSLNGNDSGRFGMIPILGCMFWRRIQVSRIGAEFPRFRLTQKHSLRWNKPLLSLRTEVRRRHGLLHEANDPPGGGRPWHLGLRQCAACGSWHPFRTVSETPLPPVALLRYAPACHTPDIQSTPGCGKLSPRRWSFTSS